MRDTLRKAVEKGIEAGVGTLRSADSALRGVTQDGKLPKEVIGYVFASIDETKNALVRGVAKEVRDFLEATDIAGEFYRALTALSFEVKTEIRFIPNEAGGIRPQIKTRAAQKRKRRKVGRQVTSINAVETIFYRVVIERVVEVNEDVPLVVGQPSAEIPERV